MRKNPSGMVSCNQWTSGFTGGKMSVRISIPYAAIREFCRRNRVRRLALFGSVLRDDFTPTSDVDMLIEFDSGVRIGLIGLMRLQNELSQIVGRKVDLRTPQDLNPLFRDEVLNEAEVIYEQAG